MKDETITHAEALDSIAFRVREALATKQRSTAGRDFYLTTDLVKALNDILAVTRAAGVGQDEGTGREWIKLTIAEPFPLFFSHVGYPSELRPETAKGPFYAAGSEWFDSPEHEAFIEWRAAGLRERGWTVTVERVTR